MAIDMYKLEEKALIICGSVPPDVRTFALYVMKKAQRARVDAGFGGSYGDGGASAIENVVEAWAAGLKGEIPRSLSDSHDQFEKESNPRYATYLQLKAEFEGKESK